MDENIERCGKYGRIDGVPAMCVAPKGCPPYMHEFKPMRPPAEFEPDSGAARVTMYERGDIVIDGPVGELAATVGPNARGLLVRVLRPTAMSDAEAAAILRAALAASSAKDVQYDLRAWASSLAAAVSVPSPPEPNDGAPSHPTIDGRPILLGDRLVSTVEVDCVHDPCFDGCPLSVDAEFRVVLVAGDVVQGDDGEEYAVADCRRVDAALAAPPSPRDGTVEVGDEVLVPATVKALLPVTMTTYNPDTKSGLSLSHDEQPGARLDVLGTEVYAHLTDLAGAAPSPPPEAAAPAWDLLRVIADAEIAYAAGYAAGVAAGDTDSEEDSTDD